MIRTWGDVAVLVVLGMMFLSFGMILCGYMVLLRQAFASPDRARALRVVWDFRGHEHEMNPTGLRLIYIGATSGLLVITLALLALVAMTLLR